MADKKNDSESESDGVEETVVGNVSKLCVVPTGYSGRPKKGHLIFDACFEGGNLGRIDYISDFEYDLFIRPDTCNPRFRVWFNFTVENVKSDQHVIFNIVNFSKTKSLYRDGMSPLVKSSSRPKWTRILPRYTYYYRCPDHRRNYVMSFAFCFDKEDDVYQFSYCYPYSYTRLQNYLDSIEKKKHPFFYRELLCLSVQQRRLDLLTITSPENMAMEGQDRQRVAFITARVHPGETPSSFVCQGLIDFLVSNHPVARILRDHIVFKIVPMLNPDGVYLGNYRCSLMGFDLNRHWLEPSPWAHPTLYAVKNMLIEMDRNENMDIDFYIDIHAHSTLMNGFMYGNVYEDMNRFERQAVFPKLLCANAEDFSLGNTNYNRDAIKAGTGRRTLGSCLDENTHCYTLEVSFYCYMPNASSSMTPYTEDAYIKLGRNVARTFLDYYRLMGIISMKPNSGLTVKSSRQSNSARDMEDKRRLAAERNNDDRPATQDSGSSLGLDQQSPAQPLLIAKVPDSPGLAVEGEDCLEKEETMQHKMAASVNSFNQGIDKDTKIVKIKPIDTPCLGQQTAGPNNTDTFPKEHQDSKLPRDVIITPCDNGISMIDKTVMEQGLFNDSECNKNQQVRSLPINSDRSNSRTTSLPVHNILKDSPSNHNDDSTPTKLEWFPLCFTCEGKGIEMKPSKKIQSKKCHPCLIPPLSNQSEKSNSVPLTQSEILVDVKGSTTTGDNLQVEGTETNTLEDDSFAYTDDQTLKQPRGVNFERKGKRLGNKGVDRMKDVEIQNKKKSESKSRKCRFCGNGILDEGQDITTTEAYALAMSKIPQISKPRTIVQIYEESMGTKSRFEAPMSPQEALMSLKIDDENDPGSDGEEYQTNKSSNASSMKTKIKIKPRFKVSGHSHVIGDKVLNAKLLEVLSRRSVLQVDEHMDAEDENESSVIKAQTRGNDESIASKRLAVAVAKKNHVASQSNSPYKPIRYITSYPETIKIKSQNQVKNRDSIHSFNSKASSQMHVAEKSIEDLRDMETVIPLPKTDYEKICSMHSKWYNMQQTVNDGCFGNYKESQNAENLAERFQQLVRKKTPRNDIDAGLPTVQSRYLTKHGNLLKYHLERLGRLDGLATRELSNTIFPGLGERRRLIKLQNDSENLDESGEGIKHYSILESIAQVDSRIKSPYKSSGSPYKQKKSTNNQGMLLQHLRNCNDFLPNDNQSNSCISETHKYEKKMVWRPKQDSNKLNKSTL